MSADKDSPISLADWESALKDGSKPDGEGASSAGERSVPPPAHDSEMAQVFENLQASGQVGDGGGMSLVMDIPITLSVELGRMKIPVKSLVQLGAGAVVELEGRAGDPLSVYANGVVVAKGEVVVVNDRFGIRLTELIPNGRPKKET